MKHKRFTMLAAVAISAGFSAASAVAQNTFYASGDLVLFFQKPGDTDTVFASLGNSATLYRGAAAGPDAGLQALNIIDLNAVLTSAFGAGWASDPEIYAGLAGVWGSSNSSNTLGPLTGQGDPHRTVYVSSPRTEVGTLGQAGSVLWDVTEAGNGALTGTSTQIFSMNNIWETTYTTQSAVSPAGTSFIDDRNPFLSVALGIQGQAFGLFEGGVQQRGSVTAFGTFGPAGSVEFALDLNRILGKNTVSGQVGGTLSVGSYEGTVTVGTNGKISFITQGTATPYDTWIGSFNPPLTNAGDRLSTADPDKDGATNLEEFGFGGNPASGSDKGTLLARTVDANSDTQGDITLTIEVRTGASFSASGNDLVSGLVDQLTYRVEGSIDLMTWDSQVSEVVPHLGTGSPSTGYVFKSFRLNGGNGLAGKGFLRAIVVK
ncbi:MAG: hypothetical protein V4689_06120 [Verrucomicrobiota bacterium]